MGVVAVENRDKAEAVVETSDGRTFRADFVIAADGPNSM
jgi:2-polyprenyl-6-methoxyphenol hydroxylase-like FAD-dependent oxidoreductase